MAFTTLLKSSTQQNTWVSGIKMLELFKLSFRAGRCKKEDDNAISYINRTIKDGDTILSTGNDNAGYIYLMRKKMKSSGRIIAFESHPHFYEKLVHLKKILKWSNVEFENTPLSDTTGTAFVYKTKNAVPSLGAVVININERKGDYLMNNITIQTLDNYCNTQNIEPNFLRVDADGNELNILKGAINILKLYKPKILIKSEERIAGAKRVLETFRLLTDLNYKGHFVLDTIKIPLRNFDFSVYQNPCNNFYCSYFMFE
jgi:FkbM family methyltransferase